MEDPDSCGRKIVGHSMEDQDSCGRKIVGGSPMQNNKSTGHNANVELATWYECRR